MNFLNIFFLFSTAAFVGATSDIKGCGGFLKSLVPIDFSSVFIKLYTKQGVLKEASDCAPTNGYYFIPIYDKGEYILKIEPPAGWFFQPKEVTLNFDGQTDLCSKASDINFNFKGFAVRGQLTTRGSDRGPDGVEITLSPEDGIGEMRRTTTGKNGFYHLSPVMPGKYILTAKHAVYKFTKNATPITIENGIMEVSSTAVIAAGYDVVGQVVSNGQPIKGVKILIYAINANNHGTPLDCDKTVLSGAPSGALCHVSSDVFGKFRFTAVATGRYVLRPYYVSFEVLPRTMEITVAHDHITLPEKFMVRGFSVKGKVLSSRDGKGLPGVAVYVDKVQVTSTDNQGQFILKDMEPSDYILSAKSDDFDFPEFKVKISPTMPELEPLVPSSVKVCGRLIPVGNQIEGQIEFRLLDRTDETPLLVTPHWENGKFCQFVPHGKYSVSVQLTDKQQSGRIQYIPASREIVVSNAPISNVDFTQLRAIVRGRIVRLPQPIRDRNLKAKLRLHDSILQSVIMSPNDDDFAFENVLPGAYEVELESDQLCFEPRTHHITVTSSEVLVPSFVQTGYVLRIQTSHLTDVKIQTLKGELVKIVTLRKGENEICLPNANKFEFEPIGCHGYESKKFIHDVAQDTGLVLKATSHDIGGTVYMKEDRQVTVEVSSNNAVIARVSSVNIRQSDNSFRCDFTFRAKDNVYLKFSPKAAKTVFTPETVEFQAKGECMSNAMQFSGEAGFLVEGRVTPPLAGVTLTLTSASLRKEQTVETGPDGKFSFGPIKMNAKFELTATKESYILTGPTVESDKSHTFQAHKLAQITVQVVDNSTNSRLTGVLLSLTGGEKYRKNSITENSGERTFHSLSPGEYFLRPMMKEYKFEPNSVIIQLKAGESQAIKVRGRRVSFSVFGMVTSLNGDPEGNVALEAVGLDTCSNLQEEGVSEATGQFRIRGLLPQCEYSVRMKSDASNNVYRIAPSDLVLKTNEGDVTGVRLIAFHRLEQVDLSVHVSATVPEHLKTLTIKLTREDMPESPIHIVRLDTVAGGVKQWGSPASQERFLRSGILVQLPFISRDDLGYLVTAESTLNRATHVYSETVVKFTADKPYLLLKLKFHASMRPAEQESPRHLVAGLLLAAATFIYWQIKQGWPLAAVVLSWLATKQESSTSKTDSSANPTEVRRKLKSRKI